MTCFVNIKLRFIGQTFKKIIVGLLKSSRCFLYQFVQLAARDGDAYDITQKLANSRKRTMTTAFHIRDNSSKTRTDQLTFLNMNGHLCVMEFLTMLAPITKGVVLFNVNRLFNNFNLLNNSTGVFNLFKFATAIREGVKSMSLKIINFVRCKRRSFVLGVFGLAANVTGTVAFFLLRRFDNIRRWRLRRVGRILRELGNLVSEFGVSFNKFSNLLFKGAIRSSRCFELLFKPGNVLNIELFFFGSQLLSSSLPTRLLSDKFRNLLVKNIDMPP